MRQNGQFELDSPSSAHLRAEMELYCQTASSSEVIRPDAVCWTIHQQTFTLNFDVLKEKKSTLELSYTFNYDSFPM